MLTINKNSFFFFNFTRYNFFSLFLNFFIYLKKNNKFFFLPSFLYLINFKFFTKKIIKIKNKKLNFQKINENFLLTTYKKNFTKINLHLFFNYNYFNKIEKIKKKIKPTDFFFIQFFIFFKKTLLLNFFFFNLFNSITSIQLIFKKYLFFISTPDNSFNNFLDINRKNSTFLCLSKNIFLI